MSIPHTIASRRRPYRSKHLIWVALNSNLNLFHISTQKSALYLVSINFRAKKCLLKITRWIHFDKWVRAFYVLFALRENQTTSDKHNGVSWKKKKRHFIRVFFSPVIYRTHKTIYDKPTVYVDIFSTRISLLLLIACCLTIMFAKIAGHYSMRYYIIQ